jgi:hypothetical protein
MICAGNRTDQQVEDPRLPRIHRFRNSGGPRESKKSFRGEGSLGAPAAGRRREGVLAFTGRPSRKGEHHGGPAT